MGSDVFAEGLNPLERFGLEVREVRTGRKLTQKQLGKAVKYSDGYVSKVEAGLLMPSERFARGCDLVFATNGLFLRLLRRVEEGDHPSWFVPYLQLEWKAVRILDFSALSIMGMLQTEEYARAIFRAGQPREVPEVINGQVAARIRRRGVLEQERPPAIWVILHEACLRTVVGGSGVMARQLEHLIRMAESPNVDIQVMPFSAGAAGVHTLAFTLLVFNDESTALYVDDVPQGGRLYRSEPNVGIALENYERLRAHALSPDDSVALIKSAHKEYRS
ncbi:helix-turn-helix domain-containing protein [Streptomyces clavuligerus]|uniref:XRE family transcriptional regulator n=1 Tax=Streptomyces clavuligerus TaxID=1901 RepID=B5GTF6_STRCL|nr:helix-turn-helix transcriptional regulator [Streptomyces clavuligerus]ANW21951.1 transcriptional regulator [Streptomyces clavuligerus]AXU16574.1 XRE family transcriptional regulator [Streptomyces clavuligerus]EDY49550.1 DNA-binding protein [Streptomyces clavuligerus]EFG07778.1 XRE family transcriptional regulator [Streptomyces clavuligerus]MBY6304015.1 helix-turn-helix domain-containing protein [Streptomyces clavuligerus]